MAIARDTSSIATLANPATSVTWSHTTASGSDRFMVVGGGVPTSDKLTSVTYNGASCTQLGTFQLGDSRGCYLHYLIAPATGANNVVISGSSDAWIGGATTYTGVDQTSPIEATEQNSGTGASLYTDDITTSTDGAYIFGVCRAGTSLSTLNDTTVLQNANGLSIFEDASATTAGTITVEMDITGTGNSSAGWILTAFKPAGAAPPATTRNAIFAFGGM